jgi:CDK inhibitor PHO81
LSKTPILAAQQPFTNGAALQDSQASLQSNKAAFFFRLERELEKVNELYLQKEAEVRKASTRFEAMALTIYSRSSNSGSKRCSTRSARYSPVPRRPRSSLPAM